jgi:hypothetical protein
MKKKRYTFEKPRESAASRLVLFPFAIPGNGAMMIAIVSSDPHRKSDIGILRPLD